MGFKHFNLKDARVSVLASQPPRKKVIDRRKFFKTLGVGAVALSPVVGSIKNVVGSPFDLHSTHNGFNVFRNGANAWKFPADVFEKSAQSFVSEQNNCYLIELKKVRFVGCEQEFDILFKIYHNDFRWRLLMEIPQFSLLHDVDFLQFLDKSESIHSKADIQYNCGSEFSNCNVGIHGKVNMELDAQWNFSFIGKQALHLFYNGDSFPTDMLLLSANKRKSQQSFVTAPAKALLLTMPGFVSWNQFVKSFSFTNGYKISSFGAPPDLNLLVWNDKALDSHSSMYVNSAEGGLAFENSRFDNFNFKHHRYFWVSEMRNNSAPETYLAAAIHNDGQWYSNPLGSFLMGSKSDMPDFEALGLANHFNSYRFAPHITSFKPAIANAVTLAAALSEPIRLKMVAENDGPDLFPTFSYAAIPDTIIRRKLNVNPVKISPTPEPAAPPQKAIKIEPQKAEPPKQEPKRVEPVREQPNKNTKIITPDEPVKRETKKVPVLDIDRDKYVLNPLNLTFRLLRPVDMLLLDFEFQNFAFTNQNAETYISLVDKQKNGLITVWFQTQHTLEQAFFESTNINDNETPKSTDEPIKLPAMHLRAHRSRLVFEYKAGSADFKLDEVGLLDWSKFDLRTHPRAWIKLANAIQLNRSGRSRMVSASSSKRTNVSLQKPEKQYSVKLTQNSKKVTERMLIYDETKLSQIIDGEIVASLKPEYKQTTISQFLNRVEAIPQDSTCIEAPALMYISPNQLGGFIHKIKASLKPVVEPKFEGMRVRSNDVHSASISEITELWHTKLGVKLKDGEISDDLPKLNSIRALWAHDANSMYTNLPPRNWPFMASLDANNRHKLVHTTSNYLLENPNNRKPFVPYSVPVNRLMLTSLGAYLDWHAFFDVPTGLDDYLNIIEWQHLATLGRDHYVKVVEEGYLFPLGHRAAIVKITERKFNAEKKSAINRQRMFVMVLEKEVVYDGKGPDNKFIEFPFQSVIIETPSTPNINDPAESPLYSFTPEPAKSKPAVKNQIVKANTAYNFLIKVNGQPFNFDITTIDKDGKTQKIRMPLVFIENFVARTKGNIDKIAPKYNNESYPNKINFNNQQVSFAESLIEDDTCFETTQIQFGAKSFESTGIGAICYHPFIQKSWIYIEQVSQLTGKKEPVTITLVDDNNKGHVFAKVIGGGNVDFSGGSDKSGGFLSPSMGITALSRLQGPVAGNIDDISNMIFKAADFFKEMSGIKMPKIFGAIDIFALFSPDGVDFGNTMKAFVDNINAIRDKIEGYKREIEILKDKLQKSGDAAKQEVQNQIDKIKNDLKAEAKKMLDQINNSVPKIPSFKTYVTEDAFHVEYKWQPELASNDIEVFPGVLSVRINGDPNKALSINTHFKKTFDTAVAPVLTTEARFDGFKVVVADMLGVNFNYLKFSGGTGGKSSVNVDLGPGMPLEFIGALDFVNSLQSIIPKTGFSDDGPYIELTTAGIKAGFTISVPNIEVGICMITNISLGAFVNLPFTGDPMTIGFNFCTKENPFMLTISCFGGGGFFQLITRLDGLQSIEAAFEFGAAISLNVGVASGGVSVMGGIYYKSETKQKTIPATTTQVEKIIDQIEAKLSAYIRINGHLSILGLIHVSLEFYLTLDAIIVDGKVQKLEGSATLKVKVEILFFSKTVSVTVRRTFAGSGGDPKFIEMIDVDDWQQYCLAFAN